MMIVTIEELAKSIDYALLKPYATEGDVKKLCDEAKKFNFASIVVNPCFVKIAAQLLDKSPVRVGTVVGFPLGANTTTEKCFATINSIVNGATEIDFVMNIGFLKSRQFDQLFRDIKAVVVSAKRGEMKNPRVSILTKVIIETGFLTDEEKRIACKIAEKAGVDFIKTSTGFANGYVTTEKDVRLLRRLLPPSIGVKASGGIENLADASKLIEVGASRIGTSAGPEIIKEYKALEKSKIKNKKTSSQNTSQE